MDEPQTAATTVVASGDLMTASRLGATGGQRAVRCATSSAVQTALAAGTTNSVLLVDLASLPAGMDDAATLAELVADARGRGIRVVAFGPHVQVELLNAARAWADEVLPRGSAFRRYGAHTAV